MRVTVVENKLNSLNNLELNEFEKQFEYPLDAHQNFRICHGTDYLRFFRAMGRATCFVARSEATVHGVLTTVERTLMIPGLGPKPAVYLCDLKVSPKAPRGRTFFRLIERVKAHFQGQDRPAYGIVMNGSARTPDRYTGALGIPRLQALAQVGILRIPVTDTFDELSADICSVEEANSCFQNLEKERVFAATADGDFGSRFPSVGLRCPNAKACGILTDTLRSKQLYSEKTELVSAHLAQFAYRRPDDGIRILASALHLCAQRNIPALFVALPYSRLADWQAHHTYPNSTVTGASIYGMKLPSGLLWNINTSEV